jgi:hypothetical protein
MVELQLSHLPQGELNIEVYDIHGKLVYQKSELKKTQFIAVSLEGLAAGTYTLVVNYQQQPYSFRLMKYQ